MCQRAVRTLSVDPASVTLARHWATAELALMYGRHDALAGDLETVVSELVTNSIKAGAHEITLAIDGHHSCLTIATTDDAAGLPVRQDPPPQRLGGRGLLIVDRLALRWGVNPDGTHKTVWADLPVPGSATHRCSPAP